MTALEKPIYGSECNACGGCCEDQICPLASLTFPQWRAPCPALAKSANGAKTCDLINDPLRYAPSAGIINHRAVLSNAAAVLCGAGIGCDGVKVSEVVTPEARRRLMRAADMTYSKSEIKEAKRVWRIK